VCPVSELVSRTRLTGDRGRLTLNMSLVELRHLEGLQSRRHLGTDGGLAGADTLEVYIGHRLDLRANRERLTDLDLRDFWVPRTPLHLWLLKQLSDISSLRSSNLS